MCRVLSKVDYRESGMQNMWERAYSINSQVYRDGKFFCKAESSPVVAAGVAEPVVSTLFATIQG